MSQAVARSTIRRSDTAPEREDLRSRPGAAVVVLVASSLALLVSLVLSISFGAADIDLATIWRAVFAYNPADTDQLVIREVRLPRVLGGVMVGAAFAMAGAIMQGMTRNPLADPSIMGLNAGAEFLLVAALIFVPGIGLNGLVVASMLGAALGATLVYGIGSLSRGGLTPVKLALAGIAVSTLLVSLSSALVIYEGLSRDLLFFFAGGLSKVRWDQTQLMFPFLLVGLVGAMLLARNITVLSLGEEVAKGLGQRTLVTKAAGAVIVVLLAGAAVWVGGPIAFVGLVVPHITRFLVGLDYRWIIPCSALLGGLLVVLADLGARTINAPYESPVGVIMAAIGVPFFLYLARRDGRGM
jgi:iron complex transport system permease protein